VGTQTVIDDNPKLDERLTGNNPVESFWSKKSHSKKIMYLTIKSKLFFQKQLISTKKTLYLISLILKKYSKPMTDAMYTSIKFNRWL
jgi:riboflavin biosynthesis pyrimidine reductase